ncbi:MAG: hypothetical protein GY883_15955 [Shimia sp.]|nr:hypothetical protein [Shimia sp.]
MVLMFVVLMLATPATAGPWPRGEGEQFLSISIETPTTAKTASQAFASAYYERGLPQQWTIGLDNGQDGLGYRKSYLFLRRPILAGRSAMVAAELGVGHQTTSVGSGFAVRPALSWGRGLRMLGRDGWLSIDSTYAYLPRRQTAVFKTEITFGLSLDNRTKTILQAAYEKERSRPSSITITPSMTYKVTSRAHLLAGAILSADDDPKLKLGLWVAF